MTAGELMDILKVLPKEQFIGFEIEDHRFTDIVETIARSKEMGESVYLTIDGYERQNIDEGEDELFFIQLKTC